MVTARQQELIFEQPSTMPDPLPGPISYLIESPSHMASDTHLRRFRAQMEQLAKDRPDDLNFPAFIAQIDGVLDWRKTVAPEDRFWRDDP